MKTNIQAQCDALNEECERLRSENTRLQEWVLALNDAGWSRVLLAAEARDSAREALRQAGDALFTAVDALAQLRELPSLVTALSGWQAASAAVKSREELT